LSDLKQSVTIKLTESDLLELQRILLDEDAEAALEFLKCSVENKLPQKDSRVCNSYNKNQYL